MLGKNKVKVFGGSKPFSFRFENWGDSGRWMEYGEEFLLTFSCGFNFKDYPFDSHVCKMEFGDQTLSTKKLILDSSEIIYNDIKHSLGDDPIIVGNSNLPFTFHLSSLESYEWTDPNDGATVSYSFTGLVMKISRKSYGKLLSGYYYPMAAFAVLSMISFLIKPDVVRTKLCN